MLRLVVVIRVVVVVMVVVVVVLCSQVFVCVTRVTAYCLLPACPGRGGEGGSVAILLLPSTEQTVRWLGARRRHVDQLELDQQREVIGRYVRMGASDHLVVPQPLGRDRPEQPERHHALLRVEYVVDNTFKFECIICIWHYIFTVR